MALPSNIQRFIHEQAEHAGTRYDDLRAVVFNGTTKRSPEVSNTDGLVAIVRGIFDRVGVEVEEIRTVDRDIPPGLWPDMREHGYDSDEFPEIYKGFVVPAHVLIIAGPVWLGDQSSLTRNRAHGPTPVGYLLDWGGRSWSVLPRCRRGWRAQCLGDPQHGLPGLERAAPRPYARRRGRHSCIRELDARLGIGRARPPKSRAPAVARIPDDPVHGGDRDRPSGAGGVRVRHWVPPMVDIDERSRQRWSGVAPAAPAGST
jgi:hypothetical protein